jgi:hypothetical protein
MTLLVARQCRRWRAPHAAVGALRRLQHPARPAIAIASRSYAHDANASNVEDQPTSNVGNKAGAANIENKATAANVQNKATAANVQNKATSTNGQNIASFFKKLDSPTYPKPQGYWQYPPTPNYESSSIVPVNSTILIPASVTATVSVSAVCIHHVLISTETRTLRREDQPCRATVPLQAKPCRLSGNPIFRAMAPRRPRLPGKGARQAVQTPGCTTADSTCHLRCCRQATCCEAFRTARCYRRGSEKSRKASACQ